MLQRRPHCVLLITPKGTIIIARRLFDQLEARIHSNDLGLLRDFDFWQQLSELINGIQVGSPTEQKQVS